MRDQPNRRALFEEKHWDEIANHCQPISIASEAAYLASLPAVWRDIHSLAYDCLPKNLSGKTVLDYGCGYGISSAMFLLRGASVVGLDISPEMIALATAQVKAVRVQERFQGFVGTEMDLATSGLSFDYIFCGAVLHHLPVFRDGVEAVWSRLKKGGILAAYEPVDSPLSSFIRHRVRYRGKHRHEFETPLQTTQIAYLKQLAASSECVYFKFFTGIERIFLSRCTWFHNLMRSLDSLCGAGVGWTGWHMVIALKK